MYFREVGWYSGLRFEFWSLSVWGRIYGAGLMVVRVFYSGRKEVGVFSRWRVGGIFIRYVGLV